MESNFVGTQTLNFDSKDFEYCIDPVLVSKERKSVKAGLFGITTGLLSIFISVVTIGMGSLLFLSKQIEGIQMVSNKIQLHSLIFLGAAFVLMLFSFLNKAAAKKIYFESDLITVSNRVLVVSLIAFLIGLITLGVSLIMLNWNSIISILPM